MNSYINDNYLNKNQFDKISEIISKIQDENCEKARDKNGVLFCTNCKVYPLCKAGIDILWKLNRLENEEKNNEKNY